MNISRLHLLLGPEWEEIYLDVDYLHAHEPPDEETEAEVAEHHHRQRGEGPHPARGRHQVSQAQLVSRVSRESKVLYCQWHSCGKIIKPTGMVAC